MAIDDRSDGEPAMKALKDAAAKAPEGADHRANGDIESTARDRSARRVASQTRLETWDCDHRKGESCSEADPVIKMKATQSCDICGDPAGIPRITRSSTSIGEFIRLWCCRSCWID